jgi:hypothetical protein
LRRYPPVTRWRFPAVFGWIARAAVVFRWEQLPLEAIATPSRSQPGDPAGTPHLMETAMTRTSRFAALTLSVAGALTVSSAAEANGIRLGFGGPMSSFVATPTHGGGSSGYGGGSAHCAKKKPSYSVASHARPHAEPRVARSEPKAVYHPRTQVVSVPRTVARPQIETAMVEKTEKIEKVAAVTVSAETPSGLTGSLALAQTENAAATTAATAATATADATPSAPVTTETAAANAEPVAVETAATAPVEQPEVKPADPAKVVGCKKFIPSVGVTIDVGCEK